MRPARARLDAREGQRAPRGVISKGIFEAALPEDYDAAEVKSFLAMNLTAVPASTGFSDLRDDYSDPLWMLLGLSALVLLIACANIANLMIARASARAARDRRAPRPRRLARAPRSASCSPRASCSPAPGRSPGRRSRGGLPACSLSFLSTRDTQWFVADAPRPAPARLHGRDRRGDVRPVRTAPGPAGVPHGPDRSDEGGRPRHRRRRRRALRAPRARRLAGRALARSPRGLAALRAQPAQPAHARRRLPARPRPRRHGRPHAPPACRGKAAWRCGPRRSSACARSRA